MRGRLRDWRGRFMLSSDGYVLRDFTYDTSSQVLSGNIKSHAWVLEEGINVFEDSKEAEWKIECGHEDTEKFVSTVLENLGKFEEGFMSRMKAFYSDEAMEVLKAIRLPMPAHSTSKDWKPDYVEIVQSLNS